MSFANQTALVTGASSGIGRELVKELAKQGARVGLVARRREALVTLADEVRSSGGVAEFAPADVADRAALHAAIAEVAAKLGPIDLLVANAGVGAPSTLDPTNIADFERMYRVNVFGVVYAVEAVIGSMLERKRGHIAAISSLAGYKGLPGEWGYTSSKAALNNLMEGLRIQLRDKGVTVTNVCPGFVRTAMTAKNDFWMPFLIDAEDAARRIVRALLRKKKVYNFPFGMSALMGLTARLPDWLVARVMGKYNENPPWPDSPLN